jgi:SAM-dependent methyltransferase
MAPHLKEAMARRLYRRSTARGEITLPAAPTMIDEYMTLCATLFGGLNRSFTPEQNAHLRAVLEEQLAAAFAESPRSSIIITYDAPIGTVLNWHVRPQWWSVEQAYENWIATREPPLFGTEPDARVWALANQAVDPATFPVLDIGAGTGRNALALARRGHPVDVVEMTPKFAEIISTEAANDGLNMRVIQRDAFETVADLRQDYQLILLSEVVSDFRTLLQVRNLFELAAHCLAPGGRLVFNAFLAREGYRPDKSVRELGQQMYTSIFTWDEINSAAAQLPLQLLTDDSVYEYERANLPDGAWPPTSWYAEWVGGQDVFDLPREECPIEMHWLVYQKVSLNRIVTLDVP